MTSRRINSRLWGNRCWWDLERSGFQALYLAILVFFALPWPAVAYGEPNCDPKVGLIDGSCLEPAIRVLDRLRLGGNFLVEFSGTRFRIVLFEDAGST
jgi:hypothetical protein